MPGPNSDVEVRRLSHEVLRQSNDVEALRQYFRRGRERAAEDHAALMRRIAEQPRPAPAQRNASRYYHHRTAPAPSQPNGAGKGKKRDS